MGLFQLEIPLLKPLLVQREFWDAVNMGSFRPQMPKGQDLPQPRHG